MQCKLKCQAFSMLNISQVILVGTDSNLCRKELTVHWSVPNSLIRSYLQPCTNSMWGDESEAVAPIIWLYQTVDVQKEEVFIPDLLITLRSYENLSLTWNRSPVFCQILSAILNDVLRSIKMIQNHWQPEKLHCCSYWWLGIVRCQDICRHIDTSHIDAETKWPPFRRRHFQTHFLEWKY